MKKEQLEIAEVLLKMGLDWNLIEIITQISGQNYARMKKKQGDKKHV